MNISGPDLKRSFHEHAHLVLVVIVGVAVARLLPHPFNVTPIGALALFAGAYISDKRFMLLPLAALLIGDLLTGLYALTVMAAVYAGFACSAMVGRAVLRQKRTPLRFIAGVLLGAISFYLISNIGMWWVAYPISLQGLLACWIDGLPFLLRTIAGDFMYGVLIFGIVEWYQSTHQQSARSYAR